MPNVSADRKGRQTSFAKTLQAHLQAWSDGLSNRPRSWSTWTDGIYPDYVEDATEMVRVDSVKLHDYVTHLRSSQAFAFNLFLPFRKGSKSRLSEYVSSKIGAQLSIKKVQFEYVPPGHLLGELDGEHPVEDEPATAVDVALWGKLEDGRSAVVLLEVKLSENGFTNCGGRDSKGNRRKDVCKSAELFFDNPRSCYLQRPWGKRRDRRYWEIFEASAGSVRAAFPNANMHGPCPFAYDLQQPMRNFAIAQALKQDGMAAAAWFGLCAHDDNTHVAEQWDKWKGMLPDGSIAPLFPASEMISVGETEGLRHWAEYMRERYMLGGQT